ncbi:MAG: hypothetical protein AAGM16_13510 [Pseudomonadota bacterium]
MADTELARVAAIEAALLEAVAADDAAQMAQCGQDRDGLIRELAPKLAPNELQELARQDTEFRIKLTALRDRVAAEIDGLRLGRRASRAYAETAQI